MEGVNLYLVFVYDYDDPLFKQILMNIYHDTRSPCTFPFFSPFAFL